jgi:SOS-response transcriptional repressor LexA
MIEQRASKKQRELLNFIDGFIKGNGYGPSYREVMRALDYKSVSTVAVHIDGLISRGFLRKHDHSARSIEVVSTEINFKNLSSPSIVNNLVWLRQEIDIRRATGGEEKIKEADILEAALSLLDQTEDKQV